MCQQAELPLVRLVHPRIRGQKSARGLIRMARRMAGNQMGPIFLVGHSNLAIERAVASGHNFSSGPTRARLASVRLAICYFLELGIESAPCVPI